MRVSDLLQTRLSFVCKAFSKSSYPPSYDRLSHNKLVNLRLDFLLLLVIDEQNEYLVMDQLNLL